MIKDLYLTHEQKQILQTLLDWVDKKESYITLGGYAGTGKTTLISHLRKLLEEKRKGIKIAFGAYTGKAAIVLENKLREKHSIYKSDSIGTIHSLMYSPVLNSNEEIIGWDKKQDFKYDLIIIDEASMVTREIWYDLLSYKTPIIAVGDHGQLPPIGGEFNLMEKPHLKLKEIHRQSKDNPIIKLSILARLTGQIPYKEFDQKVKKLSMRDSDTQDLLDSLAESFDGETLFICGYNSTRNKLNQFIRSKNDIYESEPITGDRVICLKNNHKKGIFNGMTGNILSIYKEGDDAYFAEIDFDGMQTFKGLIAADQFNAPTTLNFTEKRKTFKDYDLFDFGYAMTVHKAQGSQAKRVVLFEERFPQMDAANWRKWLYTGITRAEEELYIIA